MDIKVGIIGAGGYTAGELLRILANHRYATVSYLASDSFSGKSVDEAHPSLKNLFDLRFKLYDLEEVVRSCDFVFLAKPHPSSFRFAGELFKKGLKMVDLSANFRLKEVNVFEDWYGVKHECPELLSKSVYGLPELYYKQVQGAGFVANPGCYPTGIVLGLAPLVEKGIVEVNRIVINSVSGFSGAGRSRGNENNLAANVVDNIKTYKVTSHPHVPEIEQELGRLSGEEVKVTFVPHVAGFERGIINTMCLKLKKPVTQEELGSVFSEFYQGKPFVRIYLDRSPEIKNVVYTNFCDIGFSLDDRTGTVIVSTVIDNLIKGASGQAVQNMNIMSGYCEEEGLRIF